MSTRDDHQLIELSSKREPLRREITTDQIINAACLVAGISQIILWDLFDQSHERRQAIALAAAMMRDLRRMSYEEIAKVFGRRHSNIRHYAANAPVWYPNSYERMHWLLSDAAEVAR